MATAATVPSSRSRLLGALLALLGAGGVILCVAGVVACWVAEAQLRQRADRLLRRLDGPVGLTARSLGQVRQALEAARAQVDTLHRAAGPEPGKQPAGFMERAALHLIAWRLGPRLGEVRQQVDSATEVAVAANTLLEHLQGLPLAEAAGLDAGQMRDVSQQLGGLTASAERLSALLDQAPGGGPSGAGGNTADLREGLKRAAASVGDLERKTEEVRRQLADLRSRLPGWLTASAVVLTVFLVWMGVGQCSLFLHGWSRLRRGRRQGAPDSRP
jgi:hypothetical protein